MNCPACGADARGGASFCTACGAQLPVACPNCARPNQSQDRFCAYCGTALQAVPHAPTPDTTVGERRHVTALFSDLVNSTGIAARLDPEEWSELSARYQHAAAEAVARFGGHVAKYLGDGLVVYFGFPEAYENAPERAVKAGLEILDAIKALNASCADERMHLAVRVGIHAGEVVVGQDGGGNPEVFGDTTNVAARVQTAAEPGTLLITAPVNHMVSGLFVIEPHGSHQLKGVPEAVELFRVIQSSGVRGRIHAAAAARGLIPFVGREEELSLLWRRWERAREGEGQLVVITGEAGIGKSRLLEEMHSRLAGVAHTWIECSCDQLLQNTPFHPVVEMMLQGLGWRPEDPPARRIRILEEILKMVGLKPTEAVPLLAPLLDLEVPNSYAPLLAAPGQQHKRLLATLAHWLFSLARTQPVVIAVEDVHWCDPSSLELARAMAEQNATLPLLILFTARQEFRAPWMLRAHHLQITLSPLSRSETRAMVKEIVALTQLSAATIEAVVQRTGGVPLFVEELTRLVIESGGRTSAREIPPTLHDSLAARLDWVGDAREIAQIGAVLGREFSYELIRAVSGASDAELQAGLDKLVAADLLNVHGVPPEALYRFKHALVQDAAYEALLKTRRRELHRTVARVLSDKFKEVVELQPEIIARHLTEAHETDAAVLAWQRAGQMATKRGALAEGEGHLRRALEVFATLPDRDARIPQELALKGDLGAALLARKGWSAPEAREIFNDAIEVSRRFSDPMATTLLLASLFGSAFTAGELAASRVIASEMISVADGSGSAYATVWANSLLAVVHFLEGDIAGAKTLAERAIASYDEEAHRADPMDPIVIARAQESTTMLLSGEIDNGRIKMREMIEFAKRRNRALDLAQARLEAFSLYFHLRDPAEVAVHAEALIADANEYDMKAYLAWGFIHLGWAKATMGKPAEGLATLKKGLDLYTAAGSRLQISRYFCMLADAQAAAGALDDALENVEEALRVAPEQRIEEPSILWKRGELLIAKAGEHPHLVEKAERDFRAAMERAHAMGAKLYELRAATSLARILKARGETSAARELVQPLYESFTDGRDARDLQEARELLDELRA
ncbi:MAG: AAA family ATPase [Candidatus Binataceae bacterium]